MIETIANRGFKYLYFTDRYNNDCVLSKSSLAFEDCVWLGLKRPEPQIMVSDAIKLGLPTEGKLNGWCSYEIPEEVFIGTQMHLTQDLAKQLIVKLQKFVDTGEL